MSPPTTPGWYWAQVRPHYPTDEPLWLAPEVVRVARSLGGTLFVQRIGLAQAYVPTDRDIHWLAPVPGLWGAP